MFGKLDAMLSELKEKQISEVRIEALYDEQYDKRGVPFLKVYVLISPTLCASYERVTFRGLKPVDEQNVKEIFEKLEEASDEIKNSVKDASFTVRCGYFQDG